MTLAQLKTFCEYEANNSRLWNKYDAATIANAATSRVALDMGFRAEAKVSASTTVATQRTYSLPADFAVLVGDPTIEFAGGTDRTLKPVSAEELDTVYPNDATAGDPTHYTIAGDTIICYPTPDDATSTIRIRYIPTPTAMVATTDSPSLPARHHELVKDRMVADLYGILGDVRYKEAVVKYEVALQRTRLRETLAGGSLPSLAWMRR